MLAEYMYVDDEPKKIVKPVTRVRFQADYDITDVLRLWGNWSRKNYYSEQKSPSLFENQQKKYKELCNDDDAMLIDSALIALSKTNRQAAEQYSILKLFYFGEKQTIEDYVATTGFGRKLERLAFNGTISITSAKGFSKQTKNIIKPLSVVDIAKKMSVDRAKIKSMKEGGENHIVGHLSAITLLTCQRLDILNSITHK
ncbi:antiterminator Q family protein [Gilliamella sp. BG7]|uniref:antiterminator Q family protein n=1 Tax=unclassified Gilliamella TaxID=2685620 RepID=UPI003986C73F